MTLAAVMKAEPDWTVPADAAVDPPVSRCLQRIPGSDSAMSVMSGW